MSEPLKIIIPALIALIGTFLTIFFGYRQWKRQQKASRYGNFFSDRHTAYKTLWEKIEDVHIKTRIESVSEADFDKLLFEVNAHILKNGLYLRDDLRDMTNKYLKMAYRVSAEIRNSEDEEERTALYNTGALPPSTLIAVNKAVEMEDLKDQIRQICLAEIGSDI
jgi:hypothetical protein